jgi:predicted flap endonuclease-1-like 5' DNA nuclease
LLKTNRCSDHRKSIKIMFGLDPLSRPVAIAEILVLLAFAAFVGWLLGRLILNGRISTLRAAVAEKEAELDDCRRAKSSGGGARNTFFEPAAPLVNSAEPVVEVPSTYVPADPLLPAFSHDDTPELTDALPLVASRTELENNELDLHGRIDEPVSMPLSTPAVAVPTVANSEAAVLDRIAARASEINFDRIGRATAAEADDLKDIVGVGPFLERKLHSLGIYTFRQVANFTKEDVDKVNSIIEFFPGRIERDDWVGQSKVFHDRKYGQRS